MTTIRTNRSTLHMGIFLSVVFYLGLVWCAWGNAWQDESFPQDGRAVQIMWMVIGMGMLMFPASPALLPAGRVTRLEFDNEQLTFVGAFRRTTLKWHEISSVTIA